MSNGNGSGGAQGAGTAIVAAVGTASGTSGPVQTLTPTPSSRVIILSAKSRVVNAKRFREA